MQRKRLQTSPVSEKALLPAPPSSVIEALEPMLSSRRLKRIEAVIAGRTLSAVAVLDGLIDPFNMSAVLRSADAFGIQEVHVIEGNAPFTASGRVTTGAERWLDLFRYRTARSCATELHRRGFQILVASPRGKLAPADLKGIERVAIAFGNEHAGVSAELSRLADGSYSVPMRGFVESLNVSAAAAITLHAAAENRGGDLSEQERAVLRARFMMLSMRDSREIVAEHLRRQKKR